MAVLAALAGCSDDSTESTTAPDLKPANNLPVANNDIAIFNGYQLNEDGSISIDVLANDTDEDGDNLIITEAKAAFGTVEIAGNEIQYKKPEGNVPRGAKDVIAYTIQDDAGSVATSSVSVYIANVDGAMPDKPVVDPGNDSNYGRPAVEDPNYGRPVVDPGNDSNYGRPAVEDPNYGRPVVDPGNDSGFNGGFEILPDLQTTVKSGESQSLTKIFAHIPPNSEITDVSALYGDASVMMGNEGHLVIGYTAPLYDDHSFDTVTYAVQLDSGDYAVGNVIVNVVVDSDNGLVRPNLPDGNTPTVRPNLPDGNTPTVDSTTQREFEIYEQDGKLKDPDVVVTGTDGKVVLSGYEISLPIAYKQEEGTKADAIYGAAYENIPGHYEDKNGSFYYFPNAEQLNKTQNDYVIVPAVNKITGKRREFSYEIQYRGKVVSEPVSVAKPEPAQIWALSDQDFPDSSYSVDSSGVIIDSFGKPVPASDGSKLYAFVAASGEDENVNDEFGRFGRVDTLCMRKDSNSSCNEVIPEFISEISRFIPVPASQLKDGYELTISSVYNLPQINGNPDQSEVVYASPVLLDIK